MMRPGALTSPSNIASHDGSGWPGQASCHRINIIRRKPTSRKPRAVRPYCKPTALWSVQRTTLIVSFDSSVRSTRFARRKMRAMKYRFLLALACVCTIVASGVGLRAQALDPIRYTLRFPAPHTHYVEVEAAVPSGGRPQVEVYMATWTPGSYLIREYERHVEAVTANAGARSLTVEKSTKNRWRITTGGAANVTLRYKVYSREMTVRNNWVESAFAMINGAPTFLTLVERAARPHEVRIELPAAWKSVQTALTPVAG